MTSSLEGEGGGLDTPQNWWHHLVMTWWQGGGGGLDTPRKWWRHLWTAPKSYLIFADPSLMLEERLRLMMARDPSELAILGHLTSCCSLISTPNAMRFGKTLQLCVIINLSFTKSGKERVSRASASLFWKLHVLSKWARHVLWAMKKIQFLIFKI